MSATRSRRIPYGDLKKWEALKRARLLPDPTEEEMRAAMLAVEIARPNGGAA